MESIERRNLVKIRVCTLPIKMSIDEASCLTVKWIIEDYGHACADCSINSVMGAPGPPINSAFFLSLLNLLY